MPERSILQETITYAYDLDGNRTSRTTNAGTETLTYSNGFEHTSTTSPAGNQAYGYDAGGRLDSIQRPGLDVTMAYDSDDKLTQATVQGGPTVTYVYDATGRRTWVDDGSQPVHHLTAPIQGGGLESPHGIADTTGTMQASFVYAGEHPLMRIDASGNAVYYLEDAMGSVLGLVDDTGSEVARFEYDSFGIERSASGSQATLPSSLQGDFRYHGQWQEASTGLYFVRARNYDPATGRFTSRDPFEGVFEEPESFHPYTWVANNPRVYRDPLGLFTLTTISVANGIQQNLVKTAKSGLINLFRERLKDEALGVAGDLFANAVGKLVPGISGTAGAAISRLTGGTNSGAAGTSFEGIIGRAVCDYLGVDGGLEYLWLEVGVDDSGKVVDNGIQCPPTRISGNANARPDFVFTKREPIDLRTSGPKSFVIGDVKIGVRAMVDKYVYKKDKSGQWAAITNHAKKYSYSRMGFFITWYSGTPGQLRSLLDNALSKGVVVSIFSLSDRTQK